MAPTKYEFMQDMLLRARNRHRKELGLCPEATEPPPSTPKPPSAPDGQAGGFQGTEKNPTPLKTDIDTVNFAGLIKLADKLGVRHDEDLWLDDEWPDKEDELRVAVAEAMERVGK